MDSRFLCPFCLCMWIKSTTAEMADHVLRCSEVPA